MEGKADEQKRRDRELLSCCAAALPDFIDEVVLSRRNALLPNLFEALKAQCFSAMAASSASTAVTSLTEVTPSTLQSEPTERPSEGQLARQEQSTVPPGWGFVPTTQSDHHKANPNRLIWTNYHQHSCSSPPTSHEEFCEAWYGLILSIQTWKRGLFFIPSYGASEWADGNGWSRAQRLLRWQRRERYASRLPTQPNHELYGIRRAVYPDRLCRLVRMSSSGTTLTENHHADKGIQRPASDIESRLHNERLSDSKLLLGVPEATTCQMLEIIDELLDKTWDAIEWPPELRRQFIKMTLEASVMPEQLVGVSKSKQEIKPFESESSLQLTENGGQKCAARCPSPKPLSDYKPTSKTFSRKELNCELHSEHDFCLTSTPSLIKERNSQEQASAGKSACNRTWLSPPRVTEADNHALHRSLRIGEQNVYYANPAKREVTNSHQKVEDNDLRRGSIPLTSVKCCSPVTELRECAETSGIVERSKPDVSIAAYNNEFFQYRAPSKAMVVNENAEAAIAGNTKLKLRATVTERKPRRHLRQVHLSGGKDRAISRKEGIGQQTSCVTGTVFAD
ncbi:uncharacterized protein LOC125940259 [Dermacentor silvarum]|uniref:uncharacterized protein LOC125940259 n=1 Tax=Dermacentor silvarum TaxID=543639 RepID=UPI002101B572|nr:uncharacterized protein LOC125940259 [Dermacentor silvarum]